jgi:hypothetical protein
VKPINLLAIALLVVAIVLALHQPSTAPKPSGPTDAALRAAVEPVATILKANPKDGEQLVPLYTAMADVVARDNGQVLKTTAVVRELNLRSLKLATAESGIASRNPDLAKAIDKVITDRLGLPAVPFDAAKQETAIDTFRALSWACAGGG